MPRPRLVVGVDLSTRSCGLAVVDFLSSGDVRYRASWQIQSPLKSDQWGRLYYMTEAITNRLLGLYGKASVELGCGPVVLDELDWGPVVFERVRLFHHGKVSLAAIRDLARLQGAICLIARDELDNAQVVEVDVRQWRKAVLGNGNASKGDVVKWATEFSGKERLGVDEAEAIALAYYGTIVEKAKQTQQSTQRKRSKRGGATNGGRSRQGRSMAGRSGKRQKR